ncbi:BLUF domain-containing protein [Sphingomonas adhaesiva]|uniref:BLUF domain-containing protein n=1 Tax=Sphingomonas adhaesiva TaxID=28212 RepID=UPI002FF56727
MLFRIIYTSRASRFFESAEMRELCHVAAANNRRNGLTGLLLYDGVRFLQALEGDHDNVISVMRRIADDKRHYDMTYAYRDRAPHREFPEWSMDAPFELGDDAQVFLEKVKSDVELVSDASLKALFIGFARLASSGRNRA